MSDENRILELDDLRLLNKNSVFNAINDAIFIHDIRTGRVLDVNDRMCEMFRCTREEAFTLEVNRFCEGTPPYSDREAAEYLKLAASGEPLVFEWRARDLTGRLFWTEINLKKAELAGREYLIAVVRDIDARKKMDQVFWESEERFRNIIKNMNDAFILHDFGGTILNVSDNMEDLFGYPRDSLIGKNLTHMGNPENVKRRIRQVIEQGSLVFEGTMKRRDGSPVHVSVSAQVISMEDGGLIQSFTRDMSDVKRAEDSLKQSEQTLDAVLSASPAGIGLVKDRRLVWANDAMYDLLGYEKGSLVGESARILYPDDSEYERVGREIYPRIAGGAAGEMEARVATSGGAIRHCYVKARALDQSDFGRGIIVVVLDITARKVAEDEKRKMEAQLQQAQKMEAIGVLAGGVAHDFNNILTAIHGHAELAKMDPDDAGGIMDHLDNITRSTERAVALTRQLLQFSRSSPSKFEVFNMNDTVAGMTNLLRRLLGEDVRIELNPGRDLWNVRADEANLEQVIMNLVLNARDAIPGGGVIRIATANTVIDADTAMQTGTLAAGSYVSLSVIDNGAGIEGKNLDRIFMPFFSTKEAGKGTGLGLSVVYGIIKSHGGVVDVISAPGAGSEFVVYLPREASRTREQEAAVADMPGDPGTERVLIVEDDENVLDLAVNIITSAGYRVLKAGNQREALELFSRFPGGISLIFSDLVLPDGHGVELADRILELDPSARLLLTSGYAGERSQADALAKRGLPFIQKPYRIAELLKRVREVLDEN